MSGPPQVAGSRRFSCSFCQKTFADGATKWVHETVIHENSGSYKCNYCERTFTGRSAKESHERRHTGEKPFRCKVCQKGFRSNDDLKSHYLDLHAEKNFRCTTCGARFGRKRTLTIHLVCHSTEKPFQCERCPLRFATKSRLQSHHLGTHAEKKHRCETCGKKFRLPCLLRRHQLKCNHPANGRVASDQSRSKARSKARSSQNNEERRVEILQPNDGSARSRYNLRPRGKRPNYPDNCDEMSESDEDQNRDDEPSESDEETICVDVLEEAEQDGTAEEDGTVELTPEMSTVSSVNLMPVHDDNRESRSPVNFEDDCDSFIGPETSRPQEDDQECGEEVLTEPDGDDVLVATTYGRRGLTPHYRVEVEDIVESDEEEQNGRPENDRDAIPSIVLSSVEDDHVD